MPKAETTTTESLKAFIRERVDQHWAAENSPLLLSNLGIQIRQRSPDMTAAIVDGLRKFLETTHIVQVVVDPIKDQKVGAVPLGVEVPKDLGSLFAVAKSKRPRFIPEFWRAFYGPLDSRRFIVLGEEPRFRVINGPIPPAGSSFEILPSDVVELAKTTANEVANAVGAKIESWLNRHKLDSASFVDVYEDGKHRGTKKGQNITSDFAEALSRLDQLDQTRILIPLDIVKKMLVMK